MKKFYLLVLMTAFGFVTMKAQIEAPENLHVSPTGWVRWTSNANPEQPEYGETFSYPFNQNIAGWTLIDGNHDGRNWDIGFDPFGGAWDYCASSTSWEGSSFHPDDYLVSKQVMLGKKSILTYQISSHQDDYPDHYGIAISTASPSNPDDFTVVFHETAAYGWNTKTIDLGAYAGRLVYIAFRHYNADGVKIDLKNVELGNNYSKDAVTFNIMLDGQMIAENIADCYYQINTNDLVEGIIYETSVQTVTNEGQSEWVSYSWAYMSCANYEGYDHVEFDENGNSAILSWENETLEGNWQHYDDGTNIEGIGLNAGTPIYWAIYIPSDQLAPYNNYRATKVAMFDYEGHRGKIMIYQGDETIPENLLYTQDYTTTGSGQYIEIPFDEFVAIDAKRGLWFVMLSITGNYPAPVGPNTGNPYGRLYSDNGTSWYDLANNGCDNSLNLRGYIEENNSVLGAMVFKNNVCLTPKPVQGNAFVDENPGQPQDYYLRKVYEFDVNDDGRFAMSCPTFIGPANVKEIADSNMGIYPNPASETITIEGIVANTIDIYNSLGQMVETLNSTQYVNVRNYNPGIYMMVINGLERVKFIKL